MNKITNNQYIKSFHLSYILLFYIQACMHSTHAVLHALSMNPGL